MIWKKIRPKTFATLFLFQTVNPFNSSRSFLRSLNPEFYLQPGFPVKRQFVVNNMPVDKTLRRSSRIRQARQDMAATDLAESGPQTIPQKKRGRSKQASKSESDLVVKKEDPTKKGAKRKRESSVSNSAEDLLLDLGKLQKGRLIKRPSATVRSPYVSDVMLINEDGEDEGEVVLAHSPALDVGGLCAPGATVFMSKRPPGGKTAFAIELLLAPPPDNKLAVNPENLVGCHPNLAEKIAEEILKKGLLKEAIGYGPAQLNLKKDKKKKKGTDPVAESPQGIILSRQKTYGDSRVDFELVDQTADSDNSRMLVEVKNVVCSDFAPEFAPKKTGPNHCVIVADDVSSEESSIREYQRYGIFPWGRVGQTFEGKKVVSERAIKHVRNLVDMIEKKDENIKATILFVVNRSDCERMRACHEQCPVFASELSEAAKKGCIVLSVKIRWTSEGKAFFDGLMPITL